ncbi:MAG: TonB family protein [Desulfuromonadaceae bacterium]
MFQQAKWFGLSLALHLAVATSLIFLASRTVERTPKAIMVVLDNLAAMDIPRRKVSQAPTLTAVRPVAPARLPEPAKPEMPRRVIQSAAPQVPPKTSVPEQNLTRELPKVSPEVPVAAASRPKVEGANPALASPAKLPLQHPAPAAEGRPSPEKAQQRYLKEHFAYIRELITKQLVYPPMARKMNWSGKVVVAFTIAEDGTVHAIRVVETSGFPILDKSAVETVRSVAPFPKPPVRAEIFVPINFRLMQ